MSRLADCLHASHTVNTYIGAGSLNFTPEVLGFFFFFENMSKSVLVVLLISTPWGFLLKSPLRQFQSNLNQYDIILVHIQTIGLQIHIQTQ